MIDGVNIFVAGQTGSGKSYLVKRSLDQVERLVIYQTKREDADYPGVYFDGLVDGDWEKCLQWWLYAKERCNRYRLVWRPRDKFDADEFDRVCRLVYACGDCTFVAEEIASYLSSRIFQATGRFQAIKNLLTAGRTRGVTCWWLTQRCFGIPREVTSEARDAYIFRMQEPADLDYVQERFGLECRLKVQALGQYEHAHWITTGKVEVGKA